MERVEGGVSDNVEKYFSSVLGIFKGTFGLLNAYMVWPIPTQNRKKKREKNTYNKIL